jgi:hypothetical protein
MGAWCALAAPASLNPQQSSFCLSSVSSDMQNHHSKMLNHARARPRTMVAGDA